MGNGEECPDGGCLFLRDMGRVVGGLETDCSYVMGDCENFVG